MKLHQNGGDDDVILDLQPIVAARLVDESNLLCYNKGEVINMELNKIITELRKEKNMSQEELAEALQVSRQAISKWENGLSNPDTENLIRLAEIFAVDVNKLVGNERAQEEVPVFSARDKGKTGAIWVLSILLAISICAAAVFAALWIEARQEPVSTTPYVDSKWESVKLYSGLMHEEIPLTLEEKVALAEYISKFHFEEEPENEKQDNEIYYGGRMYYVEFDLEDVHFLWYFSERDFTQTVTFADGRKTGYSYDVDWTLLYEIDRYVYQGG